MAFLIVERINNFKSRYRRLGLWSEIAFWGSFASIISLIVGFVVLIWPKPLTSIPPRALRAEDIRLRFSVASYAITDEDLHRAPAILHCKGKLDLVRIEFDVRVVPRIIYGATRARPMPAIWYESEHMTIYNLALLNKRGIKAATFQFTLPMELRGFAGKSTQFEAELFLEQWYFTGYRTFEGGTVEIPIDRSSTQG